MKLSIKKRDAVCSPIKDNLSGRLGPVVATVSGYWAEGGHFVVYINQKKRAVTQISIMFVF